MTVRPLHNCLQSEISKFLMYTYPDENEQVRTKDALVVAYDFLQRASERRLATIGVRQLRRMRLLSRGMSDLNLCRLFLSLVKDGNEDDWELFFRDIAGVLPPEEVDQLQREFAL